MYSGFFRSGSSGSFFSVGRMGRSGSFWVLLVVFRYSEFEGISALLSKNVNKLSRFFFLSFVILFLLDLLEFLLFLILNTVFRTLPGMCDLPFVAKYGQILVRWISII